MKVGAKIQFAADGIVPGVSAEDIVEVPVDLDYIEDEYDLFYEAELAVEKKYGIVLIASHSAKDDGDFVIKNADEILAMAPVPEPPED